MPNTSSQHDLIPHGAVACVVLTVVLAGAKLSGLLPGIGWFWVLLPALLPLAVVVLLLALALVMEWAVRKL